MKIFAIFVRNTQQNIPIFQGKLAELYNLAEDEEQNSQQC